MLLRKMMIAAALLSVAPVATQAQAQDGVMFSPDYDRCREKPENDNTPGILRCGEAELKFQDARLNKAYRADMADLADAPEAKAALLKAQRAWIAFRDADCDTVQALSGGTIRPIYVQSCYLKHTARRAQALEELLQP
ncbi:lysozyme inhibitor LprI family protein [Caulobacter vibrioides]|uniref:Lysozyme inhibitor LprI family protein n=1 Tax=Caulobacter vibrioides TaxID=155892 RepID=A0A290MRD0_CAUVI|nr:lysozyme inhibitor LprI family protein [Caulobacter vibrioides]ATC30895.1 lysozyme inhibitor LprI family protein [Caulobacter vibrioides]